MSVRALLTLLHVAGPPIRVLKGTATLDVATAIVPLRRRETNLSRTVLADHALILKYAAHRERHLY